MSPHPPVRRRSRGRRSLAARLAPALAFVLVAPAAHAVSFTAVTPALTAANSTNLLVDTNQIGRAHV